MFTHLRLGPMLLNGSDMPQNFGFELERVAPILRTMEM